MMVKWWEYRFEDGYTVFMRGKMSQFEIKTAEAEHGKLLFSRVAKVE